MTRNRSALLLAVLFISVAVPAAAQTPSVEASVGYSMLRDNDASENFPIGWVGSVAGNMNRWFGIVGEVGGNYKTLTVPGTDVDLRLSVHTFMAGPKLTSRQNRSVTPFVQVLFGAARQSGNFLGVGISETDFAYQPGGGVDFNLNHRLGVRVEGDYRGIKSEGTTSKEFRFVTGIVFRTRTY